MSNKLYEGQDINDLIEEELEKGGVGSGKRGHTTPASGRHPGTESHFQSGGAGGSTMGERAAARKETREQLVSSHKQWRKWLSESGNTKSFKDKAHAAMSRIEDRIKEMDKVKKSEMDINDLVEQDMDHEETFYKGGVGSGKKGHVTHHEKASHHEREYHRLYDMADDFESSSDPEVRATGKKYREEGSKHEGLAEAHKKQMRTMTSAEKDAKIKANDKKIADHPVKTSKNSPTGG